MEYSFEKRYFRLPRGEIAYLRFILESYDGIAFARTLEPVGALVEIAFCGSRQGDADALLRALAGEISLAEVAPPLELPPL